VLRVGTLLALVVVATLTACGGGDDGSSAGSGRLVVLNDLAPVSEAFDADKGHARLVLLLSPT
jgi:hypothetical protein